MFLLSITLDTSHSHCYTLRKKGMREDGGTGRPNGRRMNERLFLLCAYAPGVGS